MGSPVGKYNPTLKTTWMGVTISLVIVAYISNHNFIIVIGCISAVNVSTYVITP